MLDKIKSLLTRNLLGDVRDAMAMHRLAPLSTAYVPWSDSALRASAVVTILDDIILNRRSCIAECGGGVSTIYIAKLLKHYNLRDRRLLTIEHDEGWIDALRDILVMHDVEDWVSLVYAPLTNTTYSLEGSPWYDIQVLEENFADTEVDLLVVDGPPAYRRGIEYARYPAVPFFTSRLADRCSIVIDDIGRRGEEALIKAWEEKLGIQFQRRIRGGNIALGVRGEAFSV